MSIQSQRPQPTRCAPRATALLIVVTASLFFTGSQIASFVSDAVAQDAKNPPPKGAPPTFDIPPFQIPPSAPSDAPKKPAPDKKPEAAKPDKKPSAPKPVAPSDKPTGKPPKAEKPAKGFQPLPEDTRLPAGTCPLCLGTTFVPHTKRVSYVHVEGDRAPSPVMTTPWQYCPQCQPERGQDELVESEKARMANPDAAHAEWEKRMEMKLVRVETRHVTLHCQITPDIARRQGEAAEAAIAYIQSKTKSCLISGTRPQSYQFVYLWDKATYHKAIEVARNLPEFKQAQDWHLFPQLACFNGDGSTVGNAAEGKLAPPEHLVISQIALWNIGVANGGQGKDWLDIGFAYHTEYAVKNKILMEYVKYQLNETRLGPNWASEARKMAGANKLIRWRDLFDSDLVAWTPPHHVTAFATVSFLMRTDPVGFAKMNILIREGASSREALEKIYGRPIDQLEAICGKWIMQGA